MFNSERFIKTCIESILTQTFQDFEIVIVDDCSTDQSASIVQNIKDPRINFVQNFKNFGESASRNLGISLARGEYIYIVDNDDALLPNTLEIFTNAARESQADVIYMNSHYETHDENFEFNSKIQARRYMTANPKPRLLPDDLTTRLQDDYIREGVSVTPWMKIQRRDFLLANKIYFPEITRCGDVLFNIAELCFGRKMQVIDACGYIHRMHKSNTTNSPAEKRLRQAIESIPTAMEYIREVFSSPNIQQNLPRSLRIVVEMETITRHFFFITLPVYRGELTLDNIDDLLEKIVSEDKMLSANLIRTLLNSLQIQVMHAQNERLRQLQRRN